MRCFQRVGGRQEIQSDARVIAATNVNLKESVALGQHGKPRTTFAPDALRAINIHRWPGNVRELQNRVQRAVIMADGKRVTAKDLQLTDSIDGASPPTLREARELLDVVVPLHPTELSSSARALHDWPPTAAVPRGREGRALKAGSSANEVRTTQSSRACAQTGGITR